MKNLNWTIMIFLAIVVITFNTTAKTQNIATNDNEWKLIKEKKKGEGWRLYKRKVSGSNFQEVKIVGIISGPMEKAQSSSMELFVDPDAYKAKNGKSLGWFKVFKQTADEIELYSFMKGNFLTKDRDVVVRYKTYEDATGNAIGVKWHHIDKEGYEATDTIIRMPIDIGDWRFDKIDSESCKATMIFQFHPGGTPPAWVINMIVKYYAPHEFEHLRQIVKTNE